MKGKVKWFNESKGYGFIDVGQGKDLFVHYSAIVSEGFKTLNDNDTVEFDEDIDKRDGKTKAVNVKVIND